MKKIRLKDKDIHVNEKILRCGSFFQSVRDPISCYLLINFLLYKEISFYLKNKRNLVILLFKVFLLSLTRHFCSIFCSSG